MEEARRCASYMWGGEVDFPCQTNNEINDQMNKMSIKWIGYSRKTRMTYESIPCIHKTQ
jgi:hypothetical protein